MIRPDGYITLESSELIMAVGLTPEQLAKSVAEKTASRLKDPSGYSNRRTIRSEKGLCRRRGPVSGNRVGAGREEPDPDAGDFRAWRIHHCSPGR
jgi:hypothetical protein